METILLIIGITTFIYLLLTMIEFVIGFNKIDNLSDQIFIDKKNLPSLSIILSALNEEDDIEKALLTLINLDYPHLEIIVVNDRSTDTTPDILDRLKQQQPRLRVHHIHQLPPGWFGKNHALHFAAQFAEGEWLLFTDADVLMKSDTLSKSISYALEHNIDHLTIYEHHQRKNFWLKILLLGHYVAYCVAMKPWRIRYSWSKKSLGHGAFNLVRKQAYEQSGGHQAIAMECLDDLKLGELLKSKGFCQDTVNGQDFVQREWYTSLKDMIEGCKKNCFAYYEYRLLPPIFDLIFALVFYIGPFFALASSSITVRLINGLNILLTIAIVVYVANYFRMKKGFAFVYPLAILLLLYMVWNSIISILKNKGVIWRGTYYPLREIKTKSH